MILPFHIDLRNRVAVVTGGGGVLGAGFAEALGCCGAKVAILDRNAEAAQRVATALQAKGIFALPVVADVLDADSLRSAAALIAAELGACDLLVNGAGGNQARATTIRERASALDLPIENHDAPPKSFFEMQLDALDGVMRLNFLGTLLPTQIFARQMIGRTGCSVINIASMSAVRPLTRVPAYSAAKAAVTNFTQWLAVHLSAMGIRVNALSPGFFLTEQNRPLLIDEQSGQLSARAQRIIDHTPMGRFGEPQELIGALLFLASEAASGFCSGLVLPIDGGFSAYSGV